MSKIYLQKTSYNETRGCIYLLPWYGCNGGMRGFSYQEVNEAVYYTVCFYTPEICLTQYLTLQVDKT